MSRDKASSADESPKRYGYSTDIAYRSQHRDKYSPLQWLTESWPTRVVAYERIATASPRLGVGIIGQGLVEQHINLLPALKSPGNFVSVRNNDGDHVGYKVKIRTWPLLKQETAGVRKFAA